MNIIKTKYYVINKSGNRIIHMSYPNQVSLYMWGRRFDNYCVLKSDSFGDRVVDWKFLTTGTLDDIEYICSIA